MEDGILRASHCLPLVIPTPLCSTVSAFRSADTSTSNAAGLNLFGPNLDLSHRVSWLLGSLDFAYAASLAIASLALTLRAGFLRALQTLSSDSVIEEVAQRIIDVATIDDKALWVRIAGGWTPVPAPPAPNAELPLPIGTPLLPIERAALLARNVMAGLSEKGVRAVAGLRALQNRRRPVSVLPDGTSARRYPQFPAEHDIASPLVAALAGEIVTHVAQSLPGPLPRVPSEGPLDPLHRRLWRLEHQSVPSARVLQLEQDGMDVHNIPTTEEDAQRARGDAAMLSVEEKDMREGGSFRMLASSSGVGVAAENVAATAGEWPRWDVFLWDFLPPVHDDVSSAGGGGGGGGRAVATGPAARRGAGFAGKPPAAESRGRIASSLYLHVDGGGPSNADVDEDEDDEADGGAGAGVGAGVGGKPGDVDEIFEDSGVFNCDDPERFKSAPGGDDAPPGASRAESRSGRGGARRTRLAASDQPDRETRQSRVRKRARPSKTDVVGSASALAGGAIAGEEGVPPAAAVVSESMGVDFGASAADSVGFADGGRLALDALVGVPNLGAVAVEIVGAAGGGGGDSGAGSGASRVSAPDSAVQLSRSLLARQRAADAAALEQLSALHLQCVPEGEGGDFNEVADDGSAVLLPDDDSPAAVARIDIADLPAETFSLVLRCGTTWTNNRASRAHTRFTPPFPPLLPTPPASSQCTKCCARPPFAATGARP